jgi:hypothetical protein
LQFEGTSNLLVGWFGVPCNHFIAAAAAAVASSDKKLRIAVMSFVAN